MNPQFFKSYIYLTRQSIGSLKKKFKKSFEHYIKCKVLLDLNKISGTNISNQIHSSFFFLFKTKFFVTTKSSNFIVTVLMALWSTCSQLKIYGPIISRKKKMGEKKEFNYQLSQLLYTYICIYTVHTHIYTQIHTHNYCIYLGQISL